MVTTVTRTCRRHKAGGLRYSFCGPRVLRGWTAPLTWRRMAAALSPKGARAVEFFAMDSGAVKRHGRPANLNIGATDFAAEGVLGLFRR